MRAWMGGWVSHSPERLANKLDFLSGTAMHIAAILGWASRDSTTLSEEILRSAEASAAGLRVVKAAVASAWYSRVRDTASRISGATT